MDTRRSRRSAAAFAAAAVVGLGVLAYASYRPSLDRARSRVSNGSRIVASPCGPIEYAEAGAGPPVLVIHGAGGGFDQGLALAPELADVGFRVIAPSRFGYLGTPLPPDASAEAQARAFGCLLDALNVRSAAVMGVSAGAPSALQFALRFPARTTALVLLVPAVYAPRRDDNPRGRASPATLFLADTILRSDFLFWAATKAAPRTMIRSILGTPPELLANAPAKDQHRIRVFLDQILPVSARRAGLLNDANIVSSLQRSDLEAIEAPTLAISAADDGYGTFDGAKYTAERVAHGRFIGYPTGGHMLVGRNAAASAEIIAFLRSREPPRIPEAVQPAARRIPHYRTVLIASDLSELSHEAMLPAYGLLTAGGRGALCYVHHIGDPPLIDHSNADLPLSDTQRQALVAALERQVPAEAAEHGIATRVSVLEARSIATALLQAAERAEADAIALATHGRSGIGRFLLGSVAEEVARRSRRPVLLIHATPVGGSIRSGPAFPVHSVTLSSR